MKGRAACGHVIFPTSSISLISPKREGQSGDLGLWLLSKPPLLSGPQEIKGLKVNDSSVPSRREGGFGTWSKPKNRKGRTHIQQQLQKPVNIKLLKKHWPWCPDQQDKG